MTNKAIILLSGGLDSATCLGLATAQGMTCYALTFDYGQRHRYELIAAQRVAQSLGVVEHCIMPISLDLFRGSALTDHTLEVPDYQPSSEIPITYVPARNTIFLSFALAYAEVKQAVEIYYGASCIDYSGYPDCRPEYVAAFQQVANLATQRAVEDSPPIIKAPLMHLSKAQTIQAGIQVGVDYSLTVSCYKSDDEGIACGLCNSCYLRRQGFEAAGISDPTLYR